MYRIRPLDPRQYNGELLMQGSVLMGEGVHLSLAGDYDSTALVLERQK
jgi:alpha-galactosidase